MKNIIVAFLLLFLSSVPVLALLRPGLPPTHDGEYHVIRAHQFDKVLRDGDWYPRWQPDLNYGYGTPLMNYYYPFPYYVTSLFHVFGASFIDSFKLGMFVPSIIGGLLFFFWARLFWGGLGAFVSSILYSLSPYHIVNIYIRGSAGELWALALFPGFLWAVTLLIRDDKSNYIVVASILLALIIFSHNIAAYIFFPFAVAYSLFLLFQKKDRKKKSLLLLATFLLGIALSSIFWIPALFESSYVTGLKIHNVEDYFPELYQLIFPSWGSGFSALDLQSQMSFQIGVANLLAVAAAIILYRKHKEVIKRSIIVFFIVWFFLFFILMLRVSKPFWDYIPFLNYIQFPWRLLIIEILIASFLAGSIFPVFRQWKSKTIGTLVIGLAMLLSIGYITPAYYMMRDDTYYLTRENFIDGTNTPGNIFNTIWFNRQLRREKEKFKVIEGEASISIDSLRSTHYRATISSANGATIQIQTAYFPGWQAFVDGEKVTTGVNKDGLIVFNVLEGMHKIEVKLLDTPLRNLAKLVSVISFFVIIVWLIRELRVRIII